MKVTHNKSFMIDVGGTTGAIVRIDDDGFDPEPVATLCEVWCM